MKKLQITKETLATLSDADGQRVAAGRPPTIDGAGCSDVVCYTVNYGRCGTKAPSSLC